MNMFFHLHKLIKNSSWISRLGCRVTVSWSVSAKTLLQVIFFFSPFVALLFVCIYHSCFVHCGPCIAFVSAYLRLYLCCYMSLCICVSLYLVCNCRADSCCQCHNQPATLEPSLKPSRVAIE